MIFFKWNLLHNQLDLFSTQLLFCLRWICKLDWKLLVLRQNGCKADFDQFGFRKFICYRFGAEKCSEGCSLWRLCGSKNYFPRIFFIPLVLNGRSRGLMKVDDWLHFLKKVWKMANSIQRSKNGDRSIPENYSATNHGFVKSMVTCVKSS